MYAIYDERTSHINRRFEDGESPDDDTSIGYRNNLPSNFESDKECISSSDIEDIRSESESSKK